MRTTVLSYLDEFKSEETAFAHRRGLRVARWSYAQIAKTAYQFARELEGRGVGKGDRVLLWAENSPEWVASFFGCLLRGVVVVPLEVESNPAFAAKVQEQVSAKLALCDEVTSRIADRNLPIVMLDEVNSLVAHHSAAPYSVANIAQDDLVEIVFTSGTTAEPKGVLITHRNLLANLTPLEQEIGPYLKWERLVHPVRFLNLLPLSHVFGQFMGIFVPQLLRGQVFFQESLNPSHIIRTVKRERISVIVTVPRILEVLGERIERVFETQGELQQFQRALDSAAGRHFILRWWKFRDVHRMFGWKFWAFVSGGAALNPQTEELWRRLGFAVVQGYGMTETAGLISVNHPFKLGKGSIGRVITGQEVKLGENGEILVRGENVSPGYWRDDAQTRGGHEGWFRTGDVGEMDEQANLYFRGRQKEVIVTSAGVNIYPGDIEVVLDRQPEIKASAVIESESAHGPEPLAVLILRDDHAKPDAVINRANESLGQHQKVMRWIVWPGEDFPRTATQKIRKQVVADKVAAALAGAIPSLAANASNPLAEIVGRVSSEPPSKLEPSAKLGTDLKLDSLGRVELLSALEDHYQVEIDEATFTDVTTLAEVEKIVREGRPRESEHFPYPRWQQKWPVSWLRIALMYSVVFPFICIMGWPKIRGKENLRALRTPVVFICNHVTMVDHALLLFALPWRFRTKMAIAQDGELLRDWRNPPKGTGLFSRLRYLLQYFSVALFFNVFSMPQRSGFRQSFNFAGEMMDRGYNLMIFPEGERTKHGEMNPFRSGSGLLIKELNAEVVPVRIDGLWRLKQARRHFARPGEISVIVGRPVRYSNQDEPEEIAHDLARRVKAL